MENTAKTKIETLTEELASLRKANEDLLFENTSLRLTIEDMSSLRDELTERIHMCDVRSEKILELTAERDEAVAEINRLQAVVESCNTMEQVILGMARGERDELRREICERESERGVKTPQEAAEERLWDCYTEQAPFSPVIKTLNGVVVSKEKAVPPKFELGEDDK